MKLRVLTLVLLLTSFCAMAEDVALVVENNTQYKLSILGGYSMKITLGPQSSYAIRSEDTYLCNTSSHELCDFAVTLWKENPDEDETLRSLGTIRLNAHDDMKIQHVYTREPLVLMLKQSENSNAVTINESHLTLDTLTSPWVKIHNATNSPVRVNFPPRDPDFDHSAPLDAILPGESQIVHNETFLEGCENECRMSIVTPERYAYLGWFTLDMNDHLKILDIGATPESGLVIKQIGLNEIEVFDLPS